MARLCIVVGHSRTGTFCEALGEACRRGAAAAGHEAALFVTAKMDFDPVLREGFERVQPLEPDLEAAHDALLAADHLVFIFPLWMGDVPAIFKGFLERVLQPDLVPYAKSDEYPRLLKGKSARLIVTTGMPAFLYRWWYGAYALKILERNALGFLGAGPVRSTVYGGVEAVGEDRRRKWLTDAGTFGARAA